MPGFDKSGPTGRGPLTGGGRGICNPLGSRTPRLGRRIFGRRNRVIGSGRPRWGLRTGLGRGRNRRW